jgi:Zn2+/Cd2+-exporting ATPase
VVEVWTPPGCDSNRLIAYAALVEKQSEHPLAIPILLELEKRGESLPSLSVSDFHSHTGLGVHARIDSTWVGIGRESLFTDHGLSFPESIQSNVDRMRALGQTALPVVTSDPKLLGVIGVADPLRANAKATVTTLKKQGVQRIVVLTGDHPKVANAIASGLDIDEIHGALLPEDKVKQLARLGGEGKVVAMVGDGVNDAPALAMADIGVAMGGAGTDVALEVADVVLMRDDLAALPTAVWIARRAYRRVRQNFLFAFGMIGLLVLASFFNLPMWLGVLGHEGSTLIVVFNGVRLLWERVPDSH